MDDAVVAPTLALALARGADESKLRALPPEELLGPRKPVAARVLCRYVDPALVLFLLL